MAFDKTSPKVAKLRENVKRFELSCVQCFVFDATKALRDDGHLLGTACEHTDSSCRIKTWSLLTSFPGLLTPAFVLQATKRWGEKAWERG